MARESSARNVGVTLPPLSDWDFFLFTFGDRHQVLTQKEIISKHNRIVVIRANTKPCVTIPTFGHLGHFWVHFWAFVVSIFRLA